MKTLFLGFGSIGQRHFRSCLRVRPHYQYFARRRADSPALPAEFQGKIESVQENDSSFSPDLVWVCSPTAFHKTDLLICARKWSSPHVMLEKPIAHTKSDIEECRKLLAVWRGQIHYGCLLRYHPMVLSVKNWIESGDLGECRSYGMTAGGDLRNWRPGVDYRTVYSAKKTMGGGVALDLIHEFNTAEFWFGPIQDLTGKKTRESELEIDVEDTCRAQTRHSRGVRGDIHLSYCLEKPTRSARLQFEEGEILADVSKGLMQITRKKEVFTETHEISRDALHDSFSRSVFESIESGSRSPWDMEAEANLCSKVIGIPHE